jgi:uncharacterized membrane protein YraQ (UPF0718 family)
MQAERGASIHLDIPFYRQHYDFTCGPASLMMATGTALTFMMAVIGLYLPEMIILQKVIEIKLILIFAGILFVSFTLMGYLINALLG